MTDTETKNPKTVLLPMLRGKSLGRLNVSCSVCVCVLLYDRLKHQKAYCKKRKVSETDEQQYAQ